MSARIQIAALLVIGITDLITTLIFLQHYGAAEANPLMAAALERGTGAFTQVKLALILIPLAVIEWARARNPTFVRRAMNACIGAYLILYLVGVTRANNPVADPEFFQPITSADIEAQWSRLGARDMTVRKHIIRAQMLHGNVQSSPGT